MEWNLSTEQILQRYDNIKTRITLSSLGVDFDFLDNLFGLENFRELYHYYYHEEVTKQVITLWLPFFITEADKITKYGGGLFYALIALSNKSRLLQELTPLEQRRAQEFMIDCDKYLKIEKFNLKESHPWSNMMFDLRLFNIALYYGYYPELMVRHLENYNKPIKPSNKDYEDLFTYLFQENNQPHLLTKSIACLDKHMVPLMNLLNESRDVRRLKSLNFTISDEEEGLFHQHADLLFLSKQLIVQALFFVKLVNYYSGRQDIAEFIVAELDGWLSADFEKLIGEIDYWQNCYVFICNLSFYGIKSYFEQIVRYMVFFEEMGANYPIGEKTNGQIKRDYKIWVNT